MRALLFLAYPLLVHLAVLLERPALQWLALQALFAAFAWPAQGRPAPRTLALWLAYATGTAALSWAGGGLYALYVPPLALLGVVLGAFASSLRPGQTPMATRIAIAARGPQPPEILAYTRQVTWLWVGVLSLLLLVTLALTLAGPRAWWSWMTNVGNYAALGATFALEYGYRRLRFPDHDREGFVGYIRLLVRHRVGRP